MEEQAKPSRSRAGAFFAHPATLILIGGAITALLSGLLVPYITRTWQNHDKVLEHKSVIQHEELGIKSKLVNQIGGASSDFLGASQLQPYDANAATAGLSTYDRAYVKWSVASAQIASQIAAYFPTSSAGQKWTYFSQNLRNTYLLLRNHPGDERVAWLRRVAAYLNLDIRTINGVLDKPLHGDRRNQTYEGALRRLLLEIQKKERFILGVIVDAHSPLENT